jgi:hypothetical protein
MTELTWKKWYYAATYALAIVAILGFFYSIYTSRQNSKMLTMFSDSIDNFTEPILQFYDLDWHWDEALYDTIDCGHPPHGINVKYINASNVPIKVLNPNLQVSMGGVVIPGQQLMEKDSVIILSPGQLYGRSLYDPLFPTFLNNKTGLYSPPFLDLRFTAIISTLNEAKKYRFALSNRISSSCTNYERKSYFTPKPSYIPIE